jgi:hypothetical protein
MVFLRAAIETGQRQEGVEYRVRHIDGSWRWHTTSGVPLRDEAGTVVGFVGTARDITERRRAEAALRESEERHRQLLESSDDWIWETDANAILTFASAKVMDLLGYTPEEVVGRSAYDLMPPGDAAKARAAVGPFVAQRKAFRGVENTNLHKSGRRVVMESNGVPVFDEGGAFLGYRGMDRDVTERRRAEEALQQQAEELRVRNDTLTRFNRVAVGRELRMMELKREVNELCAKLGEPPRHRLAGDETAPPASKETQP